MLQNLTNHAHLNLINASILDLKGKSDRRVTLHKVDVFIAANDIRLSIGRNHLVYICTDSNIRLGLNSVRLANLDAAPRPSTKMMSKSLPYSHSVACPPA